MILFVILAWTNFAPRREGSPLADKLKLGVVFGLGALAVMTRPIEVDTGVYIDLRTIPISIAGLVGGWPGALVATVIAGAYRLWLGGAGAGPGLAVIGLVAAIGAGGSLLLAGRIASLRESILFSFFVSACDLFVVMILPLNSNVAALHREAPLWILIVFVTTSLATLATFNELRRRQTDKRLKMCEAVIQSLPESLNVKDSQGRFLLANPATAALMRAGPVNALLGRSDHDFYPAELADRFQAEERNILASGRAQMIEQTIAWRGSDPIILSTLKAPLYDDAGELVGIITHNRDLTEKRKLIQALADSEKIAQAALSNMADGLIMFDADLKVIFCNERYRSMFPLTADLRVPGAHARDILEGAIQRGEFIGIPPDGKEDFIEAAIAKLRLAGTVEFRLEDGRWIESRTTISEDGGCLVVCSDITRAKRDEQKLRDLNEKLEEMAMTDSLTELLNRRAFDASLVAEMDRCREVDGDLSLLLIDVDRFKAYNDTYGHTAGDECLRQVARVVRGAARRRGDRAARYGGEEMAVILPNTTASDAVTIAQELRKRVRALDIPHVGSEKGVVTASIGVAVFHSAEKQFTPAQFVGLADAALYDAKAAGRDTVRGGDREAPEHDRVKMGGH
ncbi:diguanylate cyclase [Rhizobium sp. TRM95796]|uniref:diguanylate cyclase n=1 Tax=Rhizobium sp. TRM95796 TaxID=2979862 RepID=UPI0021E71713|nr:diguanylate cyclase [Rhizobium sp. TRM95796]MCV3765074.1 diguanylate cyclase [Rhizobium sp. TRM95796]